MKSEMKLMEAQTAGQANTLDTLQKNMTCSPEHGKNK